MNQQSNPFIEFIQTANTVYNIYNNYNNYNNYVLNPDPIPIQQNVHNIPTYSQIFSTFVTDMMTRALTSYIESYNEYPDRIQNVEEDNSVEEMKEEIKDEISPEKYIISKFSELYKNEENKEKEDCSICFEEFLPESEIIYTICRHIYHKKCLVEWAVHKKNCPQCREDLS